MYKKYDEEFENLFKNNVKTYMGFKISLDNILKKFIIRTFKSKKEDLKLITVMFAPSLKRNK